jgi:chaperonin cofactor prefoldin
MVVTKEDINRVVRGPNDLEETIELLKKQRDYLQGQCRRAGKEIENLKAELARSKEDHQYDNLVHQNELKSVRKK